MRGSANRIPLALLLDAYGAKALPYLTRKPPGPTSPLGRLGMDERRGYVSPADAKARRRQLTRSKLPPGMTETAEGRLGFKPGFVEAQGALAKAKRGSGGRITLAQQRDNIEIDAARRELEASGLSREEILRRSQKATDTGRKNPDYDPFIGRLVGAATQRKIGDDPEFEQFYSRVYGTGPGALDEEFSQVLQGTTFGAQPSAPASSPGAAGTISAPPPSAAPARTPPPTEMELRRRSAAKSGTRKTVVIQGQSYEILKENPDGTVVVMNLATGQQMIAEYER